MLNTPVQGLSNGSADSDGLPSDQNRDERLRQCKLLKAPRLVLDVGFSPGRHAQHLVPLAGRRPGQVDRHTWRSVLSAANRLRRHQEDRRLPPVAARRERFVEVGRAVGADLEPCDGIALGVEALGCLDPFDERVVRPVGEHGAGPPRAVVGVTQPPARPAILSGRGRRSGGAVKQVTDERHQTRCSRGGARVADGGAAAFSVRHQIRDLRPPSRHRKTRPNDDRVAARSPTERRLGQEDTKSST